MPLDIVITGAGRGIGKATAIELDKSAECRLFLVTKSTPITYPLNNVHYAFYYDLSDRVQVRELANKIAEKTDGIDVLINNAGIVLDRTVKKMTYDEWDAVINNNLNLTLNVTKELLPLVRKNGCIVNVASIIGLTGNFGQANYAAAKAGIIGFTKSLARELAKDNIRVVAIAPGFVETDMTRNLRQEIRERLCEKILLGRFATPEEIARFIRFIVLEGTYCTGCVYRIDGGYCG